MGCLQEVALWGGQIMPRRSPPRSPEPQTACKPICSSLVRGPQRCHGSACLCGRAAMHAMAYVLLVPLTIRQYWRTHKRNVLAWMGIQHESGPGKGGLHCHRTSHIGLAQCCCEWPSLRYGMHARPYNSSPPLRSPRCKQMRLRYGPVYGTHSRSILQLRDWYGRMWYYLAPSVPVRSPAV